jgi:putative GTP pyrophosphokinase
MRSLPRDYFAEFWKSRPDLMREYVSRREHYEALCAEVSFILAARLNETGIEVSAVSSRAKSLNSFAEKVLRKGYSDPLAEITDLAGVRVVFLYRSDRIHIEHIIEHECDVIEKVDKVDNHDVDQFGYGALHYLVTLGAGSSGARYDSIRHLICEIQVRTVLQDTWALIDHHLSYKQDADVPKQLRRKINSLAGLFETADDQFDRLRSEREQYIHEIRRELTSADSTLEKEVNLDTLRMYLGWRFEEKTVRRPQELSAVVSSAQRLGFATLRDVEALLEQTEEDRARLDEEVGPTVDAESGIKRALALKFQLIRHNLQLDENVMAWLVRRSLRDGSR